MHIIIFCGVKLVKSLKPFAAGFDLRLSKSFLYLVSTIF